MFCKLLAFAVTAMSSVGRVEGVEKEAIAKRITSASFVIVLNQQFTNVASVTRKSKADLQNVTCATPYCAACVLPSETASVVSNMSYATMITFANTMIAQLQCAMAKVCSEKHLAEAHIVQSTNGRLSVP